VDAPVESEVQDDEKRFSAAMLAELGARVFVAAGSSADEARLISEHLVEANLVGHDSHGVIRIKKYVDWSKAGQVLPNRHVELVADRGAALLLDGGFGYGQVLGREAMALAAGRAAKFGFAVAALRNAGHLGRIGAWAEQLAAAGYASFHFVNTSGFGILVAPHGGSDRRLSANPIAAGAPVKDGPPLILDIATSVIAEGKIQVARNKHAKIAPGQVLDGAGRPTDDPEAFYARPPGAILPFGGHKGSGLSLFCEILAGSLTGGFASNPKTPTAGRLVNNMTSMVFDPAAFAGKDFFDDDLARLMAWTKASPSREPGAAVLLPGDIEIALRRDRTVNGIPLDPETRSQIKAAAVGLEVDAGDL
jgi:uncharacterized oxidoreductase